MGLNHEGLEKLDVEAVKVATFEKCGTVCIGKTRVIEGELCYVAAIVFNFGRRGQDFVCWIPVCP